MVSEGAYTFKALQVMFKNRCFITVQKQAGEEYYVWHFRLCFTAVQIVQAARPI